MKILLLGEYSNVHATLKRGLESIGCEVLVASNGDFWKNYPRDISLDRRVGKIGGVALLLKILRILPQLTEFDVVQLINPIFVDLKAERIFPLYKILRRKNKKMFLCGMGMDYYWVNTCVNEKSLQYSDFNIGDKLRNEEDAIKERKDWIGTAKERLNKYIANDCDGIITGLYEYWQCYQPKFPDKTKFIPLPIELPNEQTIVDFVSPLKLFIGINKERNKYKGTDIMLKAAQEVERRYPKKVKLNIVESVPFEQYQAIMNGSDAILDQLYSYTPSMNSLLAMSKGIICIGGGEEENYEILAEKQRPIINVKPNYESVVEQLEWLIMHPECITTLKGQSIEYVKKHHDHIKVAKQYLQFYNKKPQST